MRTPIITACLAFLAVAAHGHGGLARNAADFPTCDAVNAGLEVTILDPVDEGDCTAGSGSASIPDHLCICHWNGSAGEWKADRGDVVWPDKYTGITIGTDTDTGRMIFGGTEQVRAFSQAMNDGRSRGTGATVCDGTFCTIATCGEGQGDCANTAAYCNTAGDADEDLVCRQNVGRNHGCGDLVDICLRESYWCTRLPACSVGTPCRAGQGDCAATDTACDTGLVCAVDAGSAWGCGSTVDICEAPASACDVSCDGCLVAGEGDCTDGTGDNDCGVGLTCVEDIGAYYDCQPTVNICEAS